MFKNIVVGVDGSETANKALVVACDLAGKYGAELHLVHVPQPDTVAFALGGIAGYHAVTTMPSDEEVNDAAEKIMTSGKQIATDNDQTILRTHVARGTPADEIVSYAKSCNGDLIVTGRRGLSGISSLIQGSTSQRINHLAKCACLSVE